MLSSLRISLISRQQAHIYVDYHMKLEMFFTTKLTNIHFYFYFYFMYIDIIEFEIMISNYPFHDDCL